MALVKKITTKEFGGLTVAQLRAKTEEHNGRFFVGRIYGSARAKEIVETPPNGVSIKFQGEFRGEGWDGNKLVSGVCYLPEVAESALAQVMDDAAGADGKARVQVEFGFDIFTIPDKGVTGYKYVVEPLLEVKASDTVAALAASFAALPVAAPQKALALDGPANPETADEEPAAPETPKATKGGKK